MLSALALNFFDALLKPFFGSVLAVVPVSAGDSLCVLSVLRKSLFPTYMVYFFCCKIFEGLFNRLEAFSFPLLRPS